MVFDAAGRTVPARPHQHRNPIARLHARAIARPLCQAAEPIRLNGQGSRCLCK